MSETELPEFSVDRIERLLDGQEFTVQQAFDKYLKSLRDPVVIKQVIELLEAGKTDEALRLLESRDHDLRAAILALIVAGAGFEIALWRQRAAARNRVITFNPAGLAAMALLQRNIDLLARELNFSNSLALKSVLRRLQTGEMSRKEASLILTGQIGLDEKRMKAIANYRSLLERGSSQALERALRDKSSDALVAGAAEKPLTPAQIDRLVTAYTKNAIRNRRFTLARTLSTRLTSESRRLAFTSMLGTLGLSLGQATHEWRSQRDFKVRHTHRPSVGLDGQRKPINQPFISPSGARLMYPGDPAAPPSEIMNCRCYEIFAIL